MDSGKLANGLERVKVLDLILKAASVILVPALLLMWAQINKQADQITELQIQQAATNANRFTAQDGAEVWQEMNEKADRDEIPPAEVTEALERLQAVQDRMEQRVHDLEMRRQN